MRIPNVAPDLDALTVWPPILATAGPGASSAGHAHHALHLVIARSGLLRIVEGGASVDAPGVLTAPDVPHALDAAGREILLVFIDPESDAGARLVASMRDANQAVRLITEREREVLLEGAFGTPFDPMRWGAAAVDRLAGVDAAKRPVHPRLKAVLRHLRSSPPDADTSIAALAEIAGLSEGRLAHVFRDAVGIPIRPYLLWLKVQRAAVAIVSGEPLGRAAAAAGFADAAHMTRTFRRMFGMAPSALRAAAT